MPEFNGLDPAFQIDHMGNQMDGHYCNHTTMSFPLLKEGKTAMARI